VKRRQRIAQSFALLMTVACAAGIVEIARRAFPLIWR